MPPSELASVRPPAVAGSFYPGAATALRQAVKALLSGVPGAADGRPKALIVPHAGYVYSGPVAATAYAQLRSIGSVHLHVVLVGPSHFSRFRGLAVPEVRAFATPLGTAKVNDALRTKALALPHVIASDRPHREEHALEVQLPFLQTALGSFDVLPLLVGEAQPSEVAEVLRGLWGGDDTLLIISSDLSHDLPYDAARAQDAATSDKILRLRAEALEPDSACGRLPLQGLLLEARRRGMKISLLDQRNSADTSGDRGRVVGYASFTLREVRP